MTQQRFDAWTRLFGASGSRRGVLVALAGLGASSLRRDAVQAKKKRCRTGKLRCGKKCCPTPCVSQSTCGKKFKCWFDVDNVFDWYDLTSQGACCDTAAECGPGQGCVKGACNAGGKAGACFSRCSS